MYSVSSSCYTGRGTIMYNFFLGTMFFIYCKLKVSISFFAIASSRVWVSHKQLFKQSSWKSPPSPYRMCVLICTSIFGFDRVIWPPYRDSSADVKGLTLETSALGSLYGGQITFLTLLIKPSIRFHFRHRTTVSSETNRLACIYQQNQFITTLYYL